MILRNGLHEYSHGGHSLSKLLNELIHRDMERYLPLLSKKPLHFLSNRGDYHCFLLCIPKELESSLLLLHFKCRLWRSLMMH